MKWVKGRHEWHMETLQGNTLQEFLDCKNVNRIFKGLVKGKKNYYLVIAA
jgi:hypothetical protein